MIIENEYGEVLNNTTPKLFWHDYTPYIKSTNNLFDFTNVKKRKSSTDRFYNLPISEKLFCYLKYGFEKSKAIYEERRCEIEKSPHKEMLKTPLLLIFEHRKLIDTTKITPELYFEIYKEIINNKISDLNDLILILKRKKIPESLNEKIKNIMIANNLEKNDVVYINFSMKSVGFFSVIHKLTTKSNFLFDGLFDSDLNSHFIDGLLALNNQRSFNFIDRVLKTSVASGLSYVRNWKFENGIKALVWFKAYMLFELNQSPEDYANSTLPNKKDFRKDFLSYEVLDPKIVAMIMKSKDSSSPVHTTMESSTISIEEKQRCSSDTSNLSKISFQSLQPHESDQTSPKRKFSNPTDNQQGIFSSLEDEAISIKKSKEERVIQLVELTPDCEFDPNQFLNGDYFDLKKHTSFSKTAEKTQHEYRPISGICKNLIEEKEVEVSSPEKKAIIHPQDTYSKCQFQLSFFFDHSDTGKDFHSIKLSDFVEKEKIFGK